MKLYIKNMVCGRCKLAVEGLLRQIDLHPLTVELGEVEIKEAQLSVPKLAELDSLLIASGFELIDDRRSRIIERIKNVVVQLVHHDNEPSKERASDIISRELHYDYPYLSKLFSEVEGITIEQYIISQKAEKIKEYLTYDELSLGEIADRMGYSSVAHLSAQFKKVTGMSPSQFKKLGGRARKPIDQVGKK